MLKFRKSPSGSITASGIFTDAPNKTLTDWFSTWGGSFYTSRGLGFLYNNHLRSNRTTPGAYGQLMPLTRSNTANVPLLAFRDDEGREVPAFGVGVAGNAWIPASTYSAWTSRGSARTPRMTGICAT